MVFKCPDCGRIKYYNSWRKVDKAMQKEAERYEGEVAIIPVRCPMCRVKIPNKQEDGLK